MISVINNTNRLSIIDDSVILSINNNDLRISVSSQGVQGIPGVGFPSGGLIGQALIKKTDANYDTEWLSINNDLTTITGQIISALRLVYVDPITGKIFYADKDMPTTAYSLLGITTQAGVIDDEIVVKTAGEWVDSNWSWNTSGDLSLFLGANGAITQGVVSGGIIAKVGYVVSPTSIFIRIADPILTV